MLRSTEKFAINKLLITSFASLALVFLTQSQAYARSVSQVGLVSDARFEVEVLNAKVPIFPSNSVEAVRPTGPSGGAASSSNGTSNAQISVQSAPMTPQAQPLPAIPVAPRSTPPPGSLTVSRAGVVKYKLSASSRIPRLSLSREAKISAKKYHLDDRLQKIVEDRLIYQLLTPELTSREEMKRLTSLPVGRPAPPLEFRDVVFQPKGRVSRVEADKIIRELRPELQLKLKKFVPLTEEELRFLSGLLLFQQGDKCPAAIGLFHKLAKSPGWQAEANYYLAMCSRKLGLETDFFERSRRVIEAQDPYYAMKVLPEIGVELPYEFIEPFGFALLKASNNPSLMAKLEAKTLGNVAYLLTVYGSSSEKYKTALEWAPKVPADHPRKLDARFMQALAEYHVGSKAKAVQLQEELIRDTTEKSKLEFQAMVALNLGRMYFQESKFKEARENFLKVYKNHPLWLQSLMEFGWSQLQSGDYEGAIGNMYSIQSPFFAAVYKPESYVIRTIGYLNLCQYADAYKSLTVLEKEYRPYLEKIDKYQANHTTYYQAVRNFMAAPGATKEVDGLPTYVLRELARHRDFTNLQKALNNQVDERATYATFDGEVEKGLKSARTLVNNLRRKSDDLRQRLTAVDRQPELAIHKQEWSNELESTLTALNGAFFQVDLYNEAKAALTDYRAEVVGGADQRITGMRNDLERVLGNRMVRLRAELARILDNNELLRYEVFAGSGENIRFQVAGGEKSNRIPANIIPKSKSLQWNFDGEYWEDEIGNYRSSLKNNCPDASHSRAIEVEPGGNDDK